MTVYVAIADKSKAIAAKGRFTREQFSYDDQQDCYRCPQGNRLFPTDKPQQKSGKTLIHYKSNATDCRHCPLAAQCLTEKARIKQLYRREHEAVVERHKVRMAQNPQCMKERGALVEHPHSTRLMTGFGILKHRARMNHFLMRGLEKCRGEFSLMTLGYNFTRVLNILGVETLRDYCVQRAENRLKNVSY